MKRAEREDWRTKSLPEKHVTLALDRTFTAREIERIQTGVVPEEMEDKWFIYWSDDTLYFHRSWTGYCVYVAHFVRQSDDYRLVSAEVNRDPAEYTETRDDHDAQMISYLIDVLLLGRRAMYPGADTSTGRGAVKQWTDVGRSMFRDPPQGA